MTPESQVVAAQPGRPVAAVVAPTEPSIFLHMRTYFSVNDSAQYHNYNVVGRSVPTSNAMYSVDTKDWSNVSVRSSVR